MTYTIVAQDPKTGQMGVATQTYNLAVGAWVPWGEGGLGVIATQSITRRTYGTDGLALMRGGMSAPKALQALLAVDEQADIRQIGMIDRHSNIATHTGTRCFPEAGEHIGANYATLANMMQQNTVWDAMASAYEAASGDFGERLLAALHAAQAEGGDMRGQQTAALLIVDRDLNRIPLIDLRVDYHPNPVQKLTKIYRLNRVYLQQGDVSSLIQQGEIAAARAILDAILEDAPNEYYLHYLRALHLAGELDEWQEAVQSLKQLFQQAPIWEDYLRREAQIEQFGIAGLGKKLLQALEEA